MERTRKSWIELACAATVVGLSTALVFAQGGGPPPVEPCTKCRPTPGQCGNKVITAADYCCCYNSWQAYWDCKEFNAEFHCVYPDYPWESCFQVL